MLIRQERSPDHRIGVNLAKAATGPKRCSALRRWCEVAPDLPRKAPGYFTFLLLLHIIGGAAFIVRSDWCSHPVLVTRIIAARDGSAAGFDRSNIGSE